MTGAATSPVDGIEQACDRLARPYLPRSAGVVVGAATASTTRVFSYGKMRLAAGDAEPEAVEPGAVLFEVGSITKIFTSILLAKRILDGGLDPEAPIATIRPEFAGTPEWITPRSLATHTSGLPRIPIPLWRVPLISAKKPYADFHHRDLVSWMARFRPRRRPKPWVRYSNLGVGLLGHLLALVADTNYETALTDEVLRPLGLADTVVSLELPSAAAWPSRTRFAASRRRPGTWTLWPAPARCARRSTICLRSPAR